LQLLLPLLLSAPLFVIPQGSAFAFAAANNQQNDTIHHLPPSLKLSS